MADRKIYSPAARKRIDAAVKKSEGSRIVGPEDGGASSEHSPDEILIGKAPSPIAKGASGTVNIYRGATKGSEAYTGGDDKTAYARVAAISANKWVYLFRRIGGYEVTPGEC